MVLVGTLALGLLAGAEATGGVIGLWTFNDDTANDSSTNSNHGTPQGGFTYVDTPRGRAIALDGNEMGNPPTGIDFGDGGGLWNFLTNPFTFSVWFSVDTSVPQGNNEWIFRMLDSSWGLGYKADSGQNRAQVFVPGASESPGGLLEPPNSFHHVLLTKNVAGMGYEWYLDGAAMLSPGGAAPVPDNTGVHLQSGFGGGNALISVMDEFVLWDEHMSAAQALAIYNAGPAYNLQPVNVVDADVGDQVATEFLSEAGTTYELESTADLVSSNNWSGTGAIAQGTGANLVLFDPAGYSTSKLYRVTIRP
jgi:hypothetical protein